MVGEVCIPHTAGSEGDDDIHEGEHEHEGIENQPGFAYKTPQAYQEKLERKIDKEHQQAQEFNGLRDPTVRFCHMPSTVPKPSIGGEREGGGVLEKSQDEVNENGNTNKPPSWFGVVYLMELEGGGVYPVVDGPITDPIFNKHSALVDSDF
jgi:hypothetical protein